jgi:hypothetical protein
MGAAVFAALVMVVVVLAMFLIVENDNRTTFECGSATLVIEGKQRGLSKETLKIDCLEALGPRR